MPLPDPESIRPELVYLFVLGPGIGETVLLRIPPDKWIVIDSFLFGRPRKPAAQAVMTTYGGNAATVVLTHPHQDHYPGILELIEQYPTAVIGCVHPKDGTEVDGNTVDATVALKAGAQATYTRIWDEWELDGHRRWDTFRNTTRSVADATVTSLHPVRPIKLPDWSEDPNEISSAMIVEWHGLKLLLGADVPNSQWPQIGEAFPDVAEHAGMKVSHHGSRGAINEVFGSGDHKRFWIITPYRRHGLPRAIDSTKGEPEGLLKGLSFVNRLHLTALPYRHDAEDQDPCETTRPQLRDNEFPSRIAVSRPVTDTAEALDRHVIVGFDQDGAIVDEHYGPGSVRVTP